MERFFCFPNPTIHKNGIVQEDSNRTIHLGCDSMFRKQLILLLALCLVAGCSSKGDGKTEELALIKRTNPEPMDIIYGMDGENEKGIITKVKEQMKMRFMM